MGRPGSTVWRWALVASTVVVPVALAWWLVHDDARSLESLAATASPVLAHPVPASLDTTITATLTGVVGEEQTITGSGLPGVVTGVSLETGVVVTAGQELYTVDTFPVRAWTDPVVLYRDVTPGTRGDDVAALQRFLAVVLQKEPRVTGIADRATRLDVMALERRSGIAQPSGVFSISWVVRANDGLVVDDVDLKLGEAAPGPGDVIAQSSPSLDSLDVQDMSGSSLVLPAGDYTLLRDGKPLQARYEDAAWRIDAGQALTFLVTGDVAVGRVSSEVQVRPVEPPTGLAVPASAVLTDSGLRYCVVVDDDGQWRTVSVVPVGTAPDGAALLEPPEGEPLTQVLVNAGEVGLDPQCP